MILLPQVKPPIRSRSTDNPAHPVLPIEKKITDLTRGWKRAGGGEKWRADKLVGFGLVEGSNCKQAAFPVNGKHFRFHPKIPTIYQTKNSLVVKVKTSGKVKTGRNGPQGIIHPSLTIDKNCRIIQGKGAFATVHFA
jgi:hypothetical protein